MRDLRELCGRDEGPRFDHAAQRLLEAQNMSMLQGAMMKSLTAVAHLSDQDLLAEVVAAAHEREATARLIALLAQVAARRLYLGEGCASLFTYCTQVLHLSEHADRALTLLLSDLEQAKLAATERPHASRPRGTWIAPHSGRRAKSGLEVWKRDGGQCAFVGTHGRCTERGFLEFHHVEPYAVGGPPVVDNVALRCRAHNMFECEQYFVDRLPLLVREDRAMRYGGVEPGPDRVERIGQRYATSRELFRFRRATCDLGGSQGRRQLCRSASVG